MNQAECMAHYLHSKMREGYYIDQAGKSGKSGKTSAQSLNDLMATLKVQDRKTAKP